jgi:RNA polymerase sigma-70 factor (ECF subfamily)
VLAVVYLIFNEGCSNLRTELSGEAIRLGRLLCAQAPDEPEALGLLALMLLHDARRDGRRAADGRSLRSPIQNPGTWDAGQIAEAKSLLDAALARREPGPYQLQAAIAALHTQRPVDWPQIRALYDELALLLPSLVVALNRAVAVAFVDGPHAALKLLDELKGLDRYAPCHATRADCCAASNAPTTRSPPTTGHAS